MTITTATELNGLDHPLTPDCQHGRTGTCFRCEKSMFPAEKLEAWAAFWAARNVVRAKPVRRCSLTGCEKVHAARGFCSSHYWQAMRELREWRRGIEGRRQKETQ